MPWDEVPGKFKAGTLRSGGPGGKKVKSKAQMVAILLSEKRAAAAGKTDYAARPKTRKAPPPRGPGNRYDLRRQGA